MDLKILSLNVNRSARLLDVINIVRSSNAPDIICLQELPLSQENLTSKFKNYGYNGKVSLFMNGSPGVGILFKERFKLIQSFIFQPGRLISVHLENLPPIMCIYAPSGNGGEVVLERRKFYAETLLNALNSNKATQPYLMGDFNCVLNRIDTADNFSRKKCDELSTILTLFNYIDVFRFLKPDEISFTFSRQNALPSRLDRFYVPGAEADCLTSYEAMSTLSDHKAILMSIKTRVADEPHQAQQNFLSWRLNTSILQHEDMLPNFEILWNKLINRKTQFTSTSTWWEEAVKPSIKSFLIKFSRTLSLERRDTKAFLYIQLEKAISENNWNRVEFCKTKLKSILSYEIEGIKVRAGLPNQLDSEEGSLYHALQSESKRKDSLDSLKIDGAVSEDKIAIGTEITNFFQALFNGQHRTSLDQSSVIDTGHPFCQDKTDYSYFLNNLPRISEDEKLSIEGPVTAEEISCALESCARGKSPGSDGLPYEFYIKVKRYVLPSLVDLFNEQLNSDVMLPSFREGITRLIKKVPGVPAVSDLRPITLLTCDYKIMSKVITKRIGAVLPTVLRHSGQLCSNPPENIHKGISDILASIEYINYHNLPAYMVSFDIQKAYDKTYINFICDVMEKLNFGANVISWIKTMHHNISCKFILGNTYSNSIQLLVSLRQGDPMAMFLFLINLLPLLFRMQADIVGLHMPGFKQGPLGYVDDMNALSTSEQDLVKLNRLFLRFEAVSGTVLNRSNKSKIMGLGKWSERTVWPLTWLKTEKCLKVFGIIFYPTFSDTVVFNWQDCLSKFTKCINIWKHRNIPSLKQRAYVLNTYGLSKLWYIGQVLPISATFVSKFEVQIKKFIWRGRLEKLALPELSNFENLGGLKLFDIKIRTGLLYMKQCFSLLQSDSNSYSHIKYWLGIELRQWYPHLALGPNAEARTSYWEEVLSSLMVNLTDGVISPTSTTISIKTLYKASSFQRPKIELKYPLNKWDLTWKRYGTKAISFEAKDILFSVLHNIHPTLARLHRFNLHPTGMCTSCVHEKDDLLHHFFLCRLVRPAWVFLRTVLGEYVDCDITPEVILLLAYPKKNDRTMIFLITNYYLFVVNGRKTEGNLGISHLKKFLRREVMRHREAHRLPLDPSLEYYL